MRPRIIILCSHANVHVIYLFVGSFHFLSCIYTHVSQQRDQVKLTQNLHHHEILESYSIYSLQILVYCEISNLGHYNIGFLRVRPGRNRFHTCLSSARLEGSISTPIAIVLLSVNRTAQGCTPTSHVNPGAI